MQIQTETADHSENHCTTSTLCFPTPTHTHTPPHPTPPHPPGHHKPKNNTPPQRFLPRVQQAQTWQRQQLLCCSEAGSRNRNRHRAALEPAELRLAGMAWHGMPGLCCAVLRCSALCWHAAFLRNDATDGGTAGSWTLGSGRWPGLGWVRMGPRGACSRRPRLTSVRRAGQGRPGHVLA